MPLGSYLRQDVPLVLILLLFAVPGSAGSIGFDIAAPMVLGVLLYRSLAGVEQKSLPEVVIASDRRTLVGEKHALRKYRRVVPKS